MKKLSYFERFKISLNGDLVTKFYTKSGLLIAQGYNRIVIGDRGPYIEFEPYQIIHHNIFIPDYAKHKLENSLSYYYEYRSRDDCFVKLYQQQMEVLYADYKVGMWYISPMELKTDKFDDLMLPLYIEKEVKEVKETRENTLFNQPPLH